MNHIAPPDTTMRVAGMISGTSVDAIDVAVCEFSQATEGEAEVVTMSLLSFTEQPMPTAVRERVLMLLDEQAARLDDLTELNFVLGRVFADALLDALKSQGMQAEDLDLIASHGQTIYHLMEDRRVPSTLQFAEPAVIAERAGITVAGDFRVADMAAGGLGAPLVSYFDTLFFGGRPTSLALQNIGGIGNVTFVPPAGNSDGPYAFDTGPGNVLIDYGARHFSRGSQQLDLDGAMAKRGQVNEALLDGVLAHPYFAAPPPKATGRELFGDAFAAQVIGQAETLGLSPEDTMATLTAITAESIARAYRAFGPTDLRELVLAGGGARNSYLVDQLRRRLPTLTVHMHDEFGVPGKAKEAITFALMGYDSLYGRSTNVPSCTGARHAVTLGKIVPGRNYQSLMKRVFGQGQRHAVSPTSSDTLGSEVHRILRVHS